MNNQVRQENGNLICLKHNKKIKMFIMDIQVPFNESLICSQCLVDKPTISNKIIAIAQAQKIIAEKYENIHDDESQKLLDSILQLSNDILEYQNKVIQQTDTIIRVLEQWTADIKGSSEINCINLIQGLYQLHQNQNYKLNDQSKINNAHLSKLLNQFQRLLNQDELETGKSLIKLWENQFLSQDAQTSDLEILTQISDSNQYFSTQMQSGILIQEEVNENIHESQIPVNTPKKIVQVSSMRQSELSLAMAFNKTGSYMAAGCNDDIKIWGFDQGKLSDLYTLQGYGEQISCIVFSKKLNWFVSSSSNTIISYKESENDWIISEPQQKHSSLINCLVLNKNENELISCSEDTSIIVWYVDCQQNLIEYNYTLNKHTSYVLCISINQSETALVSCSEDDTIILWMKGLEKWEYISNIKVSFGFRICFISDTQFILQPKQVSKALIYQIENRKLIEIQKINLRNANDDWMLFPTIFNNEKQVIIQKQLDSSYQFVLEPINCQDIWNYGCLTEDGEFLVIWNLKTSEFRVHQIFY